MAGGYAEILIASPTFVLMLVVAGGYAEILIASPTFVSRFLFLFSVRGREYYGDSSRDIISKLIRQLNRDYSQLLL